MREEDLRATFGALHGREAPVRAFEAADVIRQGERVRRGRRTFAVVGSGFATVAAVAAALFLLPLGEAQQPPAPVGPARPQSVQPTTPPMTTPQTSAPASTTPPTTELSSTEQTGTETRTTTPASTPVTTSATVAPSITTTKG